MLEESGQLCAENALKYLNILGKHFSRKVEVEFGAARVVVYFPSGDCVITVSGKVLSFRCTAEDQGKLQQVKAVIDGHIRLLKGLRGKELQWKAAR